MSRVLVRCGPFVCVHAREYSSIQTHCGFGMVPGMDPLSKRRVWDMIQRLKSNRVVLLTTHSMEEADTLGDTIAILQGGKLRACGNSMFLKKTFGSGHTVTLISDVENTAHITDIVKCALPAAEILNTDAGNISVSLSRGALRGLPRLFATLMAEDGLIKEWGISNTTLDEVFMRLAGQNDLNAAVEGSGNVSTIGVVRRPRDPTTTDIDQQHVLCVLETTDPTGLVVVSPVDTDTMETVVMPMEIGSSEHTGADEDVVIGQLGLPQTHQNDQIPAESSPEKSSTRMISVVVPPDGQPGQQITIRIGGHPISVRLPAGATPGQRIQLPAPLPQGMTTQTPGVQTATFMAQVHSILYKNATLALGRRSWRPGPIGCWGLKADNVLYLLCFLVSAIMMAIAAMVVSEEYGRCHDHLTTCTGTSGVINASYDTVWDLTESLYYSYRGSYLSRYRCDTTGLREAGPLPTGTILSRYNRVPDLISSCDTDAVVDRLVNFGRRYFQHPDLVWSSCDNLQPNSCLDNHELNLCWESSPWLDIWFTDPPSPALGSVSQLRLFPTGGLSSNTPWFVRIQADNVLTKTLAGQMDVQAMALDPESSDCIDPDESAGGVLVDNATVAAEWYRSRFPAFAIEFKRIAVSSHAAVLHCTIRLWTTQASDRIKYPQVLFLERSQNGNTGYTCLRCGLPYRRTTADRQLQQIINSMSNALFRTIIPDAPVLQTRMIPMPPTLDIGNLAVKPRREETTAYSIVFPLLTMLPLPSMVAVLANERENDLIATWKASGGRVEAYFVGSAMFCCLYSACFNAALVLMIYATGGSDIINLPGWKTCGLMFCWAIGQAGYICFIVFVLFKRARNSVMFGMFNVMLSVALGYMITEAHGNRALALPWLLVPTFNYARTAAMLVVHDGGEEFDRSLRILCIDGLLYFFAAVARQLLPQWISKLSTKIEFTKLYPNVEIICTGGDSSDVYCSDEDVEEERQRICQLHGQDTVDSSCTGVVTRRLVKDYWATFDGRKVKKRAVGDLCLSMRAGEVFGVLGPNGAGKTTTINLLTGVEMPSSGTASVCGFDIRTQADMVRKVIGVCPQHDRHWSDLTVRQHLVFFTLMHGVPMSQAAVEARKLAEKVQLNGDDYNMRASSLSGGMKRRLSIAIALVSQPRVCFFDEPSTGLDPETRRDIWRMIKAERASGRCLVVTTHSMEEADTLCDRIGIISGGGLRCLGTPLHLKRKFSEGLAISATVDSVPTRKEAIESLMLSLSQRAKLSHTTGRQLTFTVPIDDGDFGGVFRIMEASKRSHGLTDWSISQESLE